MSQPRPSLRLQLLFQLVFLASAAVVLVGLISVLLAGGDIAELLVPLAGVWAGSTAVFVLFGAHLMHRYVLDPIARLSEEADDLAGGIALGGRPEYESRELAHLAARYRAMAEDLLDAQSHVVRVEKLAGIGRLAAGVAHEVRNPLGAIGTYVEVLRNRGAEPEVLDEMRGSVDRIERIVASLLDYSRPGAATGTADAGAALRTAADFLEAQGALRGHGLTVEIDSGLPPVRGDGHAIEQVAVNLLLNACDAGAETRIWAGVRAHRLEARHREAARAGEATSGNGGDPASSRDFVPRPRRADLPAGTRGALLFVADDGPGVASADRERVFDPFFTTKEPGKGTGLGLAIVARTVHAAGGIVWVDRAREGGAAFKVFLPATDSAAN
jgi:two-component system NtrC family sensor kinase